jgi:hypothetical protein
MGPILNPWKMCSVLFASQLAVPSVLQSSFLNRDWFIWSSVNCHKNRNESCRNIAYCILRKLGLYMFFLYDDVFEIEYIIF